jgi:hypothetical protein
VFGTNALGERKTLGFVGEEADEIAAIASADRRAVVVERSEGHLRGQRVVRAAEAVGDGVRLVDQHRVDQPRGPDLQLDGVDRAGPVE